MKSENIQKSIVLLNDAVSLLNRQQLQTIDLDLALDKIRGAYDLVLNNKENIAEELKPFVEIKKEPAVVTEKKVLKQEENLLHLEEKEKPVVENKVKQTSIEVTEKVKEQVETVSKKDSKSAHPEAHDKIIAETLATPQTPVYEHISRTQSKKNIANTLLTTPVTDIEKAIGVNDRFLFIRELFNGDADSYDKSIKLINQATNFNEAFVYLEQTFSWDFESELVKRLLDFLRRRYIGE